MYGVLQMYKLSKEQYLLLALCNKAFPPSDEVRALVKEDINWTTLFVDSLWHKVAFIVLENLLTSGLADSALREGSLPLLIFNHWKQLYNVNSIRNAIYLKEAQEISILLKNRNIDVVVSKGGVALIGKVYTISNRKMYDIDFIGRREQHKEILRAFHECGYQLGNYEHGTDRITPLGQNEMRKWLMHTRGLPNFIKPINSEVMPYLIAQVQYLVGTTAKNETISSEIFLNSAAEENGVITISEPDLLIQLVLHLYRETHEDSFQEWNMDWNLIKFCDLDRFFHYLHNRGELNKFLNRVDELKLHKPCIYSFELVNMVFPSQFITDCLIHLKARVSNEENNVVLFSKKKIMEFIFRVGKTDIKNESGWSSLMEVKTT